MADNRLIPIRSGGDLRHVKSLVLEATGRYDLIDENGKDTGLVGLINAGQRQLDRMVDTPGSTRRHSVPLPAGGYLLLVEDLRVAEQVWIGGSYGLKQLDKRGYDWLRKNYPFTLAVEATAPTPAVRTEQTAGTTSEGAALYWCNAPLAYSNRQNRFTESLNMSFRRDLDASIIGESWDMKGIMIAPALSTESTVTVFGKFHSPALVEDSDKSWWTMNEPMALCWATCYMLEVLYRNSEGMKDWMGALQQCLTGIDHDMAEEEAAEINEITEYGG